jgi:hypothetical protein
LEIRLDPETRSEPEEIFSTCYEGTGELMFRAKICPGKVKEFSSRIFSARYYSFSEMLPKLESEMPNERAIVNQRFSVVAIQSRKGFK